MGTVHNSIGLTTVCWRPDSPRKVNGGTAPAPEKAQAFALGMSDIIGLPILSADISIKMYYRKLSVSVLIFKKKKKKCFFFPKKTFTLNLDQPIFISLRKTDI